MWRLAKARSKVRSVVEQSVVLIGLVEGTLRSMLGCRRYTSQPGCGIASHSLFLRFTCLNIWPRGVSAAGREVMSIVVEPKAKIYPHEASKEESIDG